MDWSGKSTSMTRRCGQFILATIVCLLLFAPPVARADEEAPKPAPRTWLQIGGASIVLIAGKDQLYAFVDRTEDDAPVVNAELSIDSADGASLALTRTSEGLFIAPFNRAGHMHDDFMVSLRSPEFTGEGQAGIAYDDLPETSGGVRSALGSPAAIALVSGSIGAIVAAMAIFWLRGARRRPATAPVGTAQAA